MVAIKKAVVLISINLILIFSSCTQYAVDRSNQISASQTFTPTNEIQVTDTPVHSYEAKETDITVHTEAYAPEPSDPGLEFISSLTERIQNDIVTDTFEGFTRNSTFQDIAEQMGLDEVYKAKVTYAVDFAGYPANMTCLFSPMLERVTLYIMPETDDKDYNTEVEDLLNKIDAEVGDHEAWSDMDGLRGYSWTTDGYALNMLTRAKHFERTNILAEVEVQSTSDSIPADFPSIFHYQFGTDFRTIYQNETPSMMQDIYTNYGYLEYCKDNTVIQFSLKRDIAAGKIYLESGSYFISLNAMERNKCIDFMESTAGTLQTVLGDPQYREYGYSEDGAFETAEEMRQSEYDEFWLYISWDELNLDINKSYDVRINLLFSDEFMNSTI